ncbi:CDF family Co(II)/Ni(II) efflux transporter DmeF [Pacificimonas sp. ICDLI1SI03]
MHHDIKHPSVHSHNFLGASHDAHARRTRWVVALTAAMMVVEIAAGLWTGSMALLADGIHMATHAGALGVAAFAYWFAKRHAGNPRFTFGTGKIGDLAGFASALVLAMFAIGIAVESFQRLLTPTSIAYTEAIWIAFLGLAVNLASAWLLGGDHHHGHGGDHSHHHDHASGHTHADNNLRSAYLHVLADALTSVLAIAALLAGRYLGWGWMDSAMGFVGAIVIARWSWSLMRDTAAVLVDADVRFDRYDEVREAIEDGDASLTDLHIWRVGPGHYSVIVSLVAANPLSPRQYAERLAVHEEYAHVTVEVHRCTGRHSLLRAA